MRSSRPSSSARSTDYPNGSRRDRCLRLIATDGSEQWDVGTGGDRIEVAADRRRLLAWLLGRLDDPTLPAVAPWQREQRP